MIFKDDEEKLKFELFSRILKELNIYQKYIANSKNSFTDFNHLNNAWTRKAGSIIGKAFIWINTKEGYEFWEHYDNLTIRKINQFFRKLTVEKEK